MLRAHEQPGLIASNYLQPFISSSFYDLSFTGIGKSVQLRESEKATPIFMSTATVQFQTNATTFYHFKKKH